MSSNEEKPKVHVNIGTIGHIDHSKRTLTYAIQQVLESGVPLETEEKLPFDIDVKNLNFIIEESPGIPVKKK